MSPAGVVQPRWLGILNLTPDSFSDGGLWVDPEAAVGHAETLIRQGAWGLDLGAESTRPGAAPLDPSTEWQRLQPVLSCLRQRHPGLRLSVDTRHAEVTRKALEVGADLINDVTGFGSADMLALARDSRATLIAMRSRIQGGQLWMPPYDGPGATEAQPAMDEMATMRDRLLAAGIAPERILLDPGFGFGTVWTEDKALWEALPRLPGHLDWPLERFCIAISRKRFTAWMAGQPDLPPRQRDAWTHKLHQQAMEWGYSLFRTHVMECKND